MTVKEIEQAIEQLPRHELNELAAWFETYHAQVWDQQIENDLNSGRLDKLLNEADDEYFVTHVANVDEIPDPKPGSIRAQIPKNSI